MSRVRCAIYTRKSSEEGLEQGFNSLDAQREACAAYILSQTSEGWTEIAERYDDGGLSGGTLERPALKRLLGDVAAGRIDIIVVYKVDRLTRSLLDFAKLVEAFDAASVSFVSVTQSFNTTTSMGRLTLNMLLSFAQFEREVTAERIRDKIAASKAKGMWMGGTVPLGYAARGRSLAIVDEHAELIRDIYRSYLALGTTRLVQQQLNAANITTPLRQRVNGAMMGGARFSQGQLHAILTNAIYAGDIVHKGKVYPGNHPPIIDRVDWDAVQLGLSENRHGERHRTRATRPSMFAGLVVDGDGKPLITTHANKGKVRYRYYVSRALHFGDASDGLRVPARELERVVIETLADLFNDPLSLATNLELPLDAALMQDLEARTQAARAALLSCDPVIVRKLVERVTIGLDGIEVACSAATLAALLGASAAGVRPPLVLARAVRLTRTGRVVRFVQSDGRTIAAAVDPSLIRLLAKAHGWWAELRKGGLDITRLAQREGVQASWVTRVLRLAFLSPQVTEAILAGRQQASVTAQMLLTPSAFDPDWRRQAEVMS